MLSPSLLDLGDVRAAVTAIVDPSGAQLSGFDQSRPANAAITSISLTANTSAVLAPSNPARRQIIITNEGGKTLYVAFAATAAVAAYTVQVASHQTYTGDKDGYTGDISGIQGGPATIRVTEITT